MYCTHHMYHTYHTHRTYMCSIITISQYAIHVTDYTLDLSDVGFLHIPGLENLYSITRTNQRLSVVLTDHDGETRYAAFSTFYIDDVGTNFTLHVSSSLGFTESSLMHIEVSTRIKMMLSF